jgi:hypothetical protein
MTGAKRQNRREEKYWSAEVAQKSDALDLEPGVFTEDDPKRIARTLRMSAEHSKRRKAGTLPIGDVDAQFLCQPRWP